MTSLKVRRSIRVRLPDRPGSLAEVARVISEGGGDVVGFQLASRDGQDAWDDFEIEVESSDDLARLVRTLRSHGHEVVGLPRNWEVRDWTLEIVETLTEISTLEGEMMLERILRAVRTIARTDHALLLCDDPEGNAGRASRRWEDLSAVAADVDGETVVWTGDRLAVEVAIVALGSSSRRPSVPHRLGGAAFLLGGTPRPGVAVAVGGRPPFLPAETERLRRFVRIISPVLPREVRG